MLTKYRMKMHTFVDFFFNMDIRTEFIHQIVIAQMIYIIFELYDIQQSIEKVSCFLACS